MKPTPEIDRKAYELAKSYLPSLRIPGVTQDLIGKYTDPTSLHPQKNPISKEGQNGLYFQILFHAQNAGMKAGVIGGSIDGVDKLAPVLYEFNPKMVLAKYGDNWEAVLNQVMKELKPRIRRRLGPRSIWPHYCQTILSAAEFIEFAQLKLFGDK